MTTTYDLTFYDSSSRFVLLSETCHGETPNVGDLVTVHPEGVPSDTSLTARVTGVQRVMRPVLNAPGTPRSGAFAPTHVAVTAQVEA